MVPIVVASDNESSHLGHKGDELGGTGRFAF